MVENIKMTYFIFYAFLGRVHRIFLSSMNALQRFFNLNKQKVIYDTHNKSNKIIVLMNINSYNINTR